MRGLLSFTPGGSSVSGRRENKMSALFKARGSTITVEEVLLSDGDFAVALRNETPELIDFIVTEDDSDCHIKEIVTLALCPTAHQLARAQNIQLHKLSACATRCLCSPCPALNRRLVNPSRPNPNSEWYLNFLKDFPSTENGRTNPIFCGHYQELFLSAIRAKPDLLRGQFAGFLAVILNHIELLGYQGILGVLTVDRTELFALPFKPSEGYRFIAKRALEYAEEFSRTRETLPCRRLQGIYAVLLQNFLERTLEDMSPFASDLEFVRPIVEATFLEPMDPTMEATFHDGIRVCTGILSSVDFARKETLDEAEDGLDGPALPVKRFIKAFARSFYERWGASKIAWDWEGELDATQRMLVAAFPVLWQGGMSAMVPLLFRDPPVSSDFNRAFAEHLCGLPEAKFLKFVHDHRILDRIIESPTAAEKPKLPLNHQVWQISKFIMTGIFKKAKAEGNPRPYRTPEEYADEYERFSSFVARKVKPHLNIIEKEKGQARLS